jgi:dienelactone hydrolase
MNRSIVLNSCVIYVTWLGACSSTPPQMAVSAPNPAPAGASASAPAAAGSVATPTAVTGAGGISGLGSAVSVPNSTVGVPVNGAAGRPAAAGGNSAAGRLAAAGGSGAAPAVGGAGRVAEAAAGNGSAGTAPNATFIREADPTEASLKTKGEFSVMSYTERMGLVGGTAYGDAAAGGDGSELYYPVGAQPPFAAMVIVPGFTAQRSDIAPWAPFLASHGIVSLAIDTNTTGDLPDVRSMALLDALASLAKENMRDGSPMQGKIDTSHLGIMGWSMGGGGTWITADAHPEVKVAVSLCGWIVDTVGAKTTVPSLQLAVQDDELAAGMSQPVYAAIPNGTPKMLVEWASGGHWTNNDPMNQSQQVGRYGLAWIKIFLEGDERYRPFLGVEPKASSDFMTNQK